MTQFVEGVVAYAVATREVPVELVAAVRDVVLRDPMVRLALELREPGSDPLDGRRVLELAGLIIERGREAAARARRAGAGA